MSHSPPEARRPDGLKSQIAWWLGRLTPSCREVTRLSSEAFEHPLPIRLRVRLALHRALCVWCARYARQLVVVHEATRRLGGGAGRPRLSEAAKNRLKLAIRARG